MPSLRRGIGPPISRSLHRWHRIERSLGHQLRRQISLFSRSWLSRPGARCRVLPVGFPRPLAEPDVRFPAHPALHVSVSAGQACSASWTGSPCRSARTRRQPSNPHLTGLLLSDRGTGVYKKPIYYRVTRHGQPSTVKPGWLRVAECPERESVQNIWALCAARSRSYCLVRINMRPDPQPPFAPEAPPRSGLQGDRCFPPSRGRVQPLSRSVTSTSVTSRRACPCPDHGIRTRRDGATRGA